MFRLLLFFSLLLGMTSASNDTKVIALKNKTPIIYSIPANTTLELKLDAVVAASDSFWVFEVHTKVLPLGLEPKPAQNMSVGKRVDTGSHLGLTVLRSDLPAPANLSQGLNVSVLLINPQLVDVSALLLVRSYETGAPVPAACTSDNQTEINRRPGVNIEWDKYMIYVNFSNAGLLGEPDFTCNLTDPSTTELTYTLYHKFLTARNFDETYLLTEMAETMLLMDDIKVEGSLVEAGFIRAPDVEYAQLASFNSYVGVPSLFAVVVTHKGNQSSVYVTGATYGCNLSKGGEEGCSVVTFPVTKLVCAILVFVGLYLALFGHRFFTASQLVFSLLLSYLIVYIAVLGLINVSFAVAVIITFFAGTLLAFLWTAVWVFIGIPILAVVVPQLLTGFLVAAAVFFLPFLQTLTFSEDKLYWPIFISIMFLPPLLLVSFSQIASILACVIVGSFSFVLTVDFFSSGSLVYMLINVVRRATVKDFNMAILTPPFESDDGILLAVFVVLALISLLFQTVRERNRAPFPPNPYPQWRWRREENQQARHNADAERVPLLGANGGAPQLITTGRSGGAMLDPDMAEQVVSSMRAYTDAITTATDLIRLRNNEGSPRVVGHIHGYPAPTAPMPPPLASAATSPPPLPPQAASTPVATASRSMRRESEMSSQAASRDIFKPTTPEGEAV